MNKFSSRVCFRKKPLSCVIELREKLSRKIFFYSHVTDAIICWWFTIIKIWMKNDFHQQSVGKNIIKKLNERHKFSHAGNSHKTFLSGRRKTFSFSLIRQKSPSATLCWFKLTIKFTDCNYFLSIIAAHLSRYKIKMQSSRPAPSINELKSLLFAEAITLIFKKLVRRRHRLQIKMRLWKLHTEQYRVCKHWPSAVKVLSNNSLVQFIYATLNFISNVLNVLHFEHSIFWKQV